ncbi:MAG: LysM peptidoglycan-binding domain-containing protein, partial [bacterium]|nr:LysM peptidoglycan-binding domain-containing protein [bacterium]
IRTYLNGDEFLNNTGIFTGIEKSAIGETTIDNANTDDGNYFSYPDGTTNDKIFLLDLGDAENANYGFTSDDNTRVATDPNCTERWWLRSPGIHGDFAASVRDSGRVIPGGFYVYYAVGSARPALNLKLSSVLFSSASGADKPTDFLETTDSSATTWKLTLKDGNNTFAAKRTDAGDLSVGASVTVDVTGFGSKTNTDYSKLSVMLVDSDNTVLAYGPTDCEVSTGEKIFTIPSYSGTASKLYIFGEKLSGGNLTDYASNMVDITTKAPNPPTPTPSEDNHINNDSSHSDNQPSGSKKNEDTYINPLSWLYHGTQAGSLCTMEHQGTVCQAAFLAATPAGYREAFSFNLSTKENGVITTSSSKKTGKFTMNIPKEYQKSGRTFALIGIDKYGHIKIFTDEDLSDESITVTLDLEGYAFSLIYTDGATLTGSQSGQTGTGSNICTVKEGDTLSQIARNLGVSRKHLIEKNKLTNPDRIKTGQKLSY